jgi:hypothetical protein
MQTSAQLRITFVIPPALASAAFRLNSVKLGS